MNGAEREWEFEGAKVSDRWADVHDPQDSLSALQPHEHCFTAHRQRTRSPSRVIRVGLATYRRLPLDAYKQTSLSCVGCAINGSRTGSFFHFAAHQDCLQLVEAKLKN